VRLVELIAARADALRRLSPSPLVASFEAMSGRERAPGVMMASGRLPCGPIGLGLRRLHEALRQAPRHGEGPGLSVLQTAEGLVAVRGRRGMGAERRLERARELFSASTKREASFLVELIGSQLRSPTLDRLVVQAIAEAGGLDPALVWQAVQCSHDLGASVRAAFGAGERGLLALVAEARPGTRREPELEAMVLEDPDDPDLAAVYGDWLLQHGQPHGPLVAAAVVPSRAEQRKRAWSKALKRFVRHEGLGPELQEWLGDDGVCEWCNGFLRRLWLPGQTVFAPDVAEAVLRLLASSAAACLQVLALDVDEVVPIRRIPPLPALTMLRLDLHPSAGRIDLGELAVHPRLEHLRLEGSLPTADRDLSGVHDLGLRRLDLKGTYDLSPLAGAPLDTVVLSSANHVDLRPLVHLPRLRVLGWGQRRAPDVGIVQQLATLEALHLRDRPSTELRAWAEARGVAVLRYDRLFER